MDELQVQFASWIDRVSRENPVPSDIEALNVGLFETPLGFTAYIIGSKEFDPVNDNWACQEDFTPTEKYFDIPISYSEGKTWKDIERSIVELVVIVRASNDDNIFSKTNVVTVGFDSGNLRRVI